MDNYLEKARWLIRQELKKGKNEKELKELIMALTKLIDEQKQ